MADQAPGPSAKTGKELRQFFTDLLDETKLRDYHANPEGYVKKQQDRGVVGADASRLILDRNRDEIEANMKLAPGPPPSTLAIVFPPL